MLIILNYGSQNILVTGTANIYIPINRKLIHAVDIDCKCRHDTIVDNCYEYRNNRHGRYYKYKLDSIVDSGY